MELNAVDARTYRLAQNARGTQSGCSRGAPSRKSAEAAARRRSVVASTLGAPHPARSRDEPPAKRRATRRPATTRPGYCPYRALSRSSREARSRLSGIMDDPTTLIHTNPVPSDPRRARLPPTTGLSRTAEPGDTPPHIPTRLRAMCAGKATLDKGEREPVTDERPHGPCSALATT